ncbi:MAG: hypothetical protein WAN11_09330 [Syntrophobacteraceae bacterium]
MTDQIAKIDEIAKVDKSVCLRLKEPLIPGIRWKICKARFCDLVDEYNQISNADKTRDTDTDDKIKAIIGHVLEQRLTFEHVHSLSALITLLLPQVVLRIRAEELVGDLRAAKFPAAGDMWYEMVLKDWDNFNEQEKRHRLVELQTKKRNFLLINRVGERLKTRLAVRAFGVMSLIVLSGVILWFTKSNWMIIAGVVGAIGGLISVLQRTYTTPSYELGRTAIDEIPSTLTVVLAPFFGAVGALIIMMGLHSGLSEFTSSTQHSSPDPVSLSVFELKNAADWYKLTLFSLAAGFSERIIPDTLGRLQSRLVQGKSA